MNTEISKMNKVLLNLQFPHIKQPIIYWGDKRRQYYNSFTKARGNSLEKVVDKDTLENNDYTLIKRSGQVTSRYLLIEIKELEAILIAELSIQFTGIVSEDVSWKIASCGIYKKDKTTYKLIHLGKRKKKRGYWGIYDSLVTEWILPIVCDNDMLLNGEAKKLYEEFSKKHPKLNIEDNLTIMMTESVDRVMFNNWTRCAIDGRCGINGETFAEMAEPIERLYGGKIKTFDGCNVCDITENPVNFSKFIRTKESKKVQKFDTKDDNLLNIKLSKVKYDEKFGSCVGVIQRIDDNMCVLRTMQKDVASKEMVDVCKIFVNKNEYFAYKKTENNGWIKMKINTKLNNFNFDLLGYDAANTKGTMFEYFTTIIDDIPLNKRDTVIKYLLADKQLEVILKSSLKDFVISYICNPYKNFDYEEWKEINFGSVDYTQNSLYKKFGVNKHQFDFIAEQYNKNTRDKVMKRDPYGYDVGYFLTFKKLQNFFDNSCSPKDISYIDDKSFDKLANALINELNKHSCTFYWIMQDVFNMYGLATLINFVEYYDAFYKACNEDNRTYKFLKDYLNMVAHLRNIEDFDTSFFKPYFDKNRPAESIKAMHDIALSIYNIKQEEIRKIQEQRWVEEERKRYDNLSKKFTSSTNKCIKWEFEDEKYVVLKPTEPVELAKEGIALHHCVGSYIEKVTNDVTNIMFIRKTSDKDKPFYTVEISNNGSIEQIHGSCNCNVESGSDLENFVKNWVKTKKLNFTNFNKVR